MLHYQSQSHHHSTLLIIIIIWRFNACCSQVILLPSRHRWMGLFDSLCFHRYSLPSSLFFFSVHSLSLIVIIIIIITIITIITEIAYIFRAISDYIMINGKFPLKVILTEHSGVSPDDIALNGKQVSPLSDPTQLQ